MWSLWLVRHLFTDFMSETVQFVKHVFDAAIQLNDKLRTQSVPISKRVIWHSNEELNALPNCSPITMKDHLVRPFVELVAGFVGSVRPPWEMMPAISAIGGDEFKSWASRP